MISDTIGDAEQFFRRPILNSPYTYPARHWELDDQGQPTHSVIESRRSAKFISPIPKARKQKGKAKQATLVFDEGLGLSTEAQQYDPTPVINELRNQVDQWRKWPNPADWQVTPETARLLDHWRNHPFNSIRPFFCQIEAVETAIWLTEVAPNAGKAGKRFLEHLANANNEANPDLMRLALKLATGAGKTTVMAMLIAWQTINAARRPASTKFTRGFLIVAPGLTIRDRLQVLQPNDPYSYYESRELVPQDMLGEMKRAKIVITNYHAFKLRERMELSKGGRSLLQGRGEPLDTLETEGQMIQRVMPELMGLKNILVLNDEAHHCYREKPGDPDEEVLKGEDRQEAERNREAARLWISGLEAVNRKLGLTRVIDLSATPFFLRGSGYVEGTLFHWTMSDFSLMDAIECGIVKLPRVPVADNIPGGEAPRFRNLWDNIRSLMPKKGRGKGGDPDPLSIPVQLQTALDALYGHYEKTYRLWTEKGIRVPPCFIVVCNNTSASKLVYDYVSGFHRKNEDGSTTLENGRLELFRNFDEHGNPFARPRTLLIDSEQLESGEALDDSFRSAASGELAQFRREIIARTGDIQKADNISDQEVLREVMNTVGKADRLGESIRCVVSVSMLTEGWDANIVTHVLGVRAFGTQLLCEQVIGRALRRQSYDLNEEGLFNVEYADILGIPFDFTAAPVIAPPQPPRDTIQVKAMRPERDRLEIRFPLARANAGAGSAQRVLLTTFSETLANALAAKLRALIHNEPRLGERVEVHSLGAIGLRLYNLNFGPARMADRETIGGLLKEASLDVEGHKFSLPFLMAEWEQVVDAWQLDSGEAYRDVVRLGRKTRLAEKQRSVLWSIFARMRAGLAERGLVTSSGIFFRLAGKFAGDQVSPFNFIVVDEAQDIGVAQLRFLAALGGNRRNALFFAGDLGQRIFQQPFSWKALGVDVRGRSFTLKINYRTSHQIRMQADRLLGAEVTDVDGNKEERRGTISIFNGPAPAIQILKSSEDEAQAVGQWLRERLNERIAPGEIGIFVRSDVELPRARQAAEVAGLPFAVLDEKMELAAGRASIGTMHLSKGLEFRTVVVMACDDEVIPLQARIETATDEGELEEVYATERHLLYVACTRARDHLLVTGVRPASEFLGDLEV